MLILLPSSERKAPVERGEPLDPSGLSFPSLAPTRAAVLDAVIEVSGEPDAERRLGVRATSRDLGGNTALRDAPTAPAGEVYAGVLFGALGLADLDPTARRRARAWIVIVSPLWGAVRPGDRIPPYRLHMCGRLPGLGHLPQVWCDPLSDVLPDAAGRGLVVDCRSGEWVVAWRPTGVLAERTVVVKVRSRRDRTRGAGAHAAKSTRGLLARRIVADGLDPRRPEDLADTLSAHFDVDLRAPDRPGRTWELHVVEPVTPAST